MFKVASHRCFKRGSFSNVTPQAKSPPVKKTPKRRHIGIQTDAMPEEFYRLQEEERRRIEEEKRRKEEEERLAREAAEKAQRELEEAEATMMGDSVMRYMKMVRRNSKTSDQKKAERFR